MDQIKHNIWLGNVYSAGNLDNLKKEGFKKILCVLDFAIPIYNEGENINRKIIKIPDIPTYNIVKHLGECLNFIQGNEKILVHCKAGASRSASIVIAYLMWDQKMSFEDALDFVAKKRLGVYPNMGFRDQLKKFEELLKKNNYDLNKIDFNSFKWEAKLSDYYKNYNYNLY